MRSRKTAESPSLPSSVSKQPGLPTAPGDPALATEAPSHLPLAWGASLPVVRVRVGPRVQLTDANTSDSTGPSHTLPRSLTVSIPTLFSLT